MNENPNKVCNCALSSFSDLFSNLIYIAFVDSGTNNPYQGFAAWNAEAMASAAWNSAHSRANGWDGFVSTVLSSGLSASDPVELVVRATLSANTTVFADTACMTTGLDDMIRGSELGN